jgi:hypothetical protein
LLLASEYELASKILLTFLPEALSPKPFETIAETGILGSSALQVGTLTVCAI